MRTCLKDYKWSRVAKITVKEMTSKSGTQRGKDWSVGWQQGLVG